MRKLLVCLAAFIVATLCLAHDPQLSGIGVAQQGDRTTVAVQAPLSKLRRGDVERQLTARLALSMNGQAYVPNHPEVVIDKAQGVVCWRASFAAPVRSLEVKQRLFPEDPYSRTILSVTRDGRPVHETILDATHRGFTWQAEREEPQLPLAVASQFFQLGVAHIFAGLDHIVFILGLILLGGGLKALLKTVTAFTLAHSITLTVAAIGLWSPPSRFVEPLIALSIVAVAFENLRSKEGSKDWRPLIAFGFGLIHGFGFAGGLTEAGLPQGSLGWALGAFNVGVECAQASIVLVATPLLAMIAKGWPRTSYRLVSGGSVAIALAGAVWFFQRLHMG